MLDRIIVVLLIKIFVELRVDLFVELAIIAAYGSAALSRRTRVL